MTYEEAIKEAQASVYDGEPLELIINALEKQIPKKPKRKPCMILCPNCESTSITLINHAPTEESYIKLAHCIECGQAIDWSKNDN